MIRKMTVVIMCLMLSLVVITKGEISVSVLSNRQTDCVEGRIEFDVPDSNLWTVGLLGKWFEDTEEPREDWAAGLFTKMAVDPNAEIPLANWLPELGQWIQLPDTLTVETYLIGKLEVYPCQTGADIVGCVGAGGEVGPIIGEYLYRIIEGGDSDNPLLNSGPEFYFGIKPIRF